MTTAPGTARARALFVGGTSSNAGKSWMVTAICAWLRARGVSVAPFKAQNMSNHSAPCPGGGEIGRAQAVQAEACGLDPEPAMNPILLKPNGQGASQVIVDGHLWRTLSARDYYDHADQLREHVLAAYHDLARRFDAVIIEGAGSVTELNLRGHDLVNLGLVTRIHASWMLVADIERGGVFGSVIGSTHLLTPKERRLFRGFAINKFRGDVSLFDEGVTMLEERTGAPCLGVFPYAEDIAIDAEDSLAVDTRPRGPAPSDARLAIVRVPHLSNATDFRLLTWADWITMPTEGHYDVVVLPGTKNTLRDLRWLRQTGLADWVIAQHARGARILGICGGYQMLGTRISDPLAMESDEGAADGLGLLPVTTTLAARKVTRRVRGTTPGGTVFDAYEIHLGETVVAPGALGGGSSHTRFARLDDGTPEGLRHGRVTGTYLHGALESAALASELLGVAVQDVGPKSDQYVRLAAWFERYACHTEALGLTD